MKQAKLDRITHNPEVMGGKACIRGMRVTVGTIVGLLATGQSSDDILHSYPYLEPEGRNLSSRRRAPQPGTRAAYLSNRPASWSP